MPLKIALLFWPKPIKTCLPTRFISLFEGPALGLFLLDKATLLSTFLPKPMSVTERLPVLVNPLSFELLAAADMRKVLLALVNDSLAPANFLIFALKARLPLSESLFFPNCSFSSCYCLS